MKTALLLALLPASALALPGPVSPGILAGTASIQGAPMKGTLWIVNAHKMQPYAVTLPALFGSVGVNALRVTAATPTTISGYLATIVSAPGGGGDLYSFTITGVAMTSLVKLNTAAFAGVNLMDIAVDPILKRIYVLHRAAHGAGGVISWVPATGGTPAVEVDLSSGQLGSYASAAAMTLHGSRLYVATWNQVFQELIYAWNPTSRQGSVLCAVPPSLSTVAQFGPVALESADDFNLRLFGEVGDLAAVHINGYVSAQVHSGRFDTRQGKYAYNQLASGCDLGFMSDAALGTIDGMLDIQVGPHAAQGVVLLGNDRYAAVTAVAPVPLSLESTGWFGEGGRGSGGWYPVQLNFGAPHLNSTWSLGLYGARGGVPALLGIGVSRDWWGPLRLPYFLGPLGAPGNYLYVACEVVAGSILPGSGSGEGWTVTTIGVPSNPALLGGTVYTQWLVADPGANALGVAVSNANWAAVRG